MICKQLPKLHRKPLISLYLIYKGQLLALMQINARKGIGILQGLRVAQAAVTERWPYKVEKRSKITFFSLKKKLTKKNIFFCIYLLVMPKYWGKQIFAHGRFPEVGQKQKTERILQGLLVAQEAVTERWPYKVEKTLENHFFLVKINKK